MTSAGSDDASGTLRIKTDKTSIYVWTCSTTFPLRNLYRLSQNVNIANSYGKGVQAIALSQYASHFGCYACQLKGYQDTLLTETGLHVFLQSYIEGAVRFRLASLRNCRH